MSNVANFITAGASVRILPNIQEVMGERGFDPAVCRSFAARFAGTLQTAFCIWQDVDGHTYVTIDLCREIPIECCELAEKP